MFINDKKTSLVDNFWNPTPELRQSRLTRCTVPLEEQGGFESEKWVLGPTGPFVIKIAVAARSKHICVSHIQNIIRLIL